MEYDNQQSAQNWWERQAPAGKMFGGCGDPTKRNKKAEGHPQMVPSSQRATVSY
jgi:hypothetical protein